MKKLLVGVIAAAALLMSGCAKTWDAAAANGGLFASSKAPYIVVKQSGGHITDVYKLQNAIIQSEHGSDGWLFLDQAERPIHIGGDMKSLRFIPVPAGSGIKTVWDCYFEYHMEFETQTYQDLHGAEAKACLAALPR
jgi:hypothetical protein